MFVECFSHVILINKKMKENEVLENMEKLTKRQQDILDFIKLKVQEKGYPPSVREIGQAVGLASSSTVHGHLSRLEEKDTFDAIQQNHVPLKF